MTAVTPPRVALRLGGMFFIQNLVWGAQVVLLAGHLDALGFDGAQIGYVLATGALGSLVSPLIAGWLADRYWPGHLVAGICYLACAPLLFIAWGQTEFTPLLLALLAFAVLHVPGAALTNAVAFYHLGDRRRFGRVRVWGSIGWIAVSWGLSLYLRLWEIWDPAADRLGDGLFVAAALSVAMGLYCFTLPHTPIARQGPGPLAFLEAFRLLGRRDFAVLMVVVFAVAAMNPFSYNFSFIFFTDTLNGPGLAPSTTSLVLSLGQLAELPLMPLLALILARLGLRRTIALGIGAQALRSLALAAGEPLPVLIAAQALNGLFIVCFIIASAVAVDQLCPEGMKASAQGLHVFALRGLGPLCGHLFAGRVYDLNALPDGSHDWGVIFLVPALVSAAFGWLFLLLFRAPADQSPAPSKRS